MRRRLIIRPEAEADIINAAFGMKAGELDWDSRSPLKLEPPSGGRSNAREHMCFFGNVQRFIEYWHDGFPIASFTSCGQTPSLSLQSFMPLAMIESGNYEFEEELRSTIAPDAGN